MSRRWKQESGLVVQAAVWLIGTGCSLAYCILTASVCAITQILLAFAGKTKTFTSHDPRVLQQLPTWFREGLPFRVTSAGTYVDKETLFLVESVGHILGPSALQQLSDEVIARRFNNEEAIGFSYHNEVTRKKTVS